ncbi:hypothetical protein [Salibacter halophilus]|uniref:Uncharacterized protein n=1 Tax=Salibacter halophilus TaxID=1803916 RepID=A0A6N6M9W9_9FLAO|nr:hypothetical protein [Salibacter halophilus]KAB1065056.1 hypothetical protein F3059_03650 [Salibacter halophilus]
MQHPFYQKTKKEQRNVQLKVGLLALTIIIIFFVIGFVTNLYLLPALLFPIVITIIAPFLDVPAMVDKGKLTYQSLLLLTEKGQNGVIKLHGGTLLDYLYVIDSNWNAQQRKQFIIKEFLSGLINLIDEQKEKKDLDIKIKGTSYILNERTAKKLGFKVVKKDFLQQVILIFNYFNLLVTNSVGKGRLSFPRIKQIITIEADISTLLAKEDEIRALKNKIEND